MIVLHAWTLWVLAPCQWDSSTDHSPAQSICKSLECFPVSSDQRSLWHHYHKTAETRWCRWRGWGNGDVHYLPHTCRTAFHSAMTLNESGNGAIRKWLWLTGVTLRSKIMKKNSFWLDQLCCWRLLPTHNIFGISWFSSWSSSSILTLHRCIRTPCLMQWAIDQKPKHVALIWWASLHSIIRKNTVHFWNTAFYSCAWYIVLFYD